MVPSLASTFLPAGALLLAVGCTGDGDSQRPTTSVGGEAAPGVSAGASDAATTSIPGLPATAGTDVPATSTTMAPDVTGIAGVDSEVPTCAGFAVVNGTFQLLAVAAAFGASDAAGLARAEIVSAPAVVAAADALFATWPAELDDERAIAQDDLVGPIERRAERAVQALRDAGATDADLDALRGAWAEVLARQARDNPDVELPDLPAALRAVDDDAADAFAADVTPYAQDPSLLRAAVETPATDAWLAQRCPEVLAVAGGDAV